MSALFGKMVRFPGPRPARQEHGLAPTAEMETKEGFALSEAFLTKSQNLEVKRHVISVFFGVRFFHLRRYKSIRRIIDWAFFGQVATPDLT